MTETSHSSAGHSNAGHSGVDHSGACHCGAVRFHVRLSAGLTTASRCNCSFCARRGAVALTAPAGGLTLLSGADNLTLYQFGSHTAKHYFCAPCGIYTHHERRFPEGELGINAACLDGVSPFDFAQVVVHDGTAHPADTGGVERDAGVLRYQPFAD